MAALNEDRLAEDLHEQGLYVLARRTREGMLDLDVLWELRTMLDGLDATLKEIRRHVANQQARAEEWLS